MVTNPPLQSPALSYGESRFKVVFILCCCGGFSSNLNAHTLTYMNHVEVLCMQAYLLCDMGKIIVNSFKIDNKLYLIFYIHFFSNSAEYKPNIKDKKVVQNSRILFYVISYMRGISSSYVFPNNKAECVSYCIYTSYVQANRVQSVYMEFYFFFLRLLFSMSYFLKPASCCYCCFLR